MSDGPGDDKVKFMSLHKLNTVSYQAITCCHLESSMAHWKFLDFPLVSLFVQLAFDFSGELSFFPNWFLFQPDKKDWTDFVNKPLYNHNCYHSTATSDR